MAQKDVCKVCGQTPCNCTSIEEAVSVKKQNYSWGKMVTVHHGASTSYPLHPEHQEAIKKLKDGESTTFRDETNSTVKASREGDNVHLQRPKTSNTKTTVAYSHFAEEVELDEAVKLGSKVRIHAPGESYHGKTGYVGEIRHGLYKGAPKTYTVDYDDGKSIQLDKKNVKLHKEEVEQIVEQKHRVAVTVSEPDHPAVSMRKATKEKFVRVTAASEKEAVERAKAHYKKQGYKIHGAEHAGMVNEETELNEANFAATMKKAIAAHERGDHKMAKYHLDNAKTARYAMKSTEIAKNKDLLDTYKKMRDMHAGIKEESQPTKETTLNPMEMYLAAIAGNADFASALAEKTLTPAEKKKREEIAQAMERENPGMDKSRKMAIATATAKRVAEAFTDDGKMSWDQWKAKAKEHGAVTYKDTNTHTHAYDKNGKRVSSISWSSKKVKKEEFQLEDFSLEELEDFMMSEDFDQLDELSKGTLARYAKAAPRSAADLDARAKEMSTIGHLAKKDGDHEQAQKFFSKAGGMAYKSAMRQRGHDKAIDRLTKEEVEQIEEISKEKVAKYLDRAQGDFTHQDMGSRHAYPEQRPEFARKKALRHKGISRAVDRLYPQTEESELGEAMISYSDFMDKLKMHRKAGNKVVDDKYTDKKATYTTIDSEGVGKKITHTENGTKQEHLGKIEGKDDEAEVKQPEKRGRGRPAGTKSGARH